MRRVQSACICQTLHFQLSEKLPHAEAVRQVKADVEAYKRTLDRNRTLYRILEEIPQQDGSILVKLKKQYNASPIGNYLDE